ncbi:MAG: FeoB-associated Cys-rich membrane protein [Deltaproteobacteria bacterium]|jgi:hypothetical protein|nr:FeoB-associated Cys-rich membrane protein [Deltaproteobacteria bacterium]
METIIVALILLGAAALTAYRIFVKPSCGCGCGGKKKKARPLSEDLDLPDVDLAMEGCDCCRPPKPDSDPVK